MTLPYDDANPLRIGTRASPLALAQAEEVRDRLRAAHGLAEGAIAIVPLSTTGDERLEKRLGLIGGKGLFTKEIEDAMLERRVDVAVHSMKDVPTEHRDGLMLGAILEREDVRDAFVSLAHESLDALPAGARVGTASLRRQAQLLSRRPDLDVVLFRGNVQTRLRKLEAGEADATFLAMAGLRRLGMTHVARGPIAPEAMLPAVAQGAIGIELRAEDADARRAVEALDHAPTSLRVRAERAFLKVLDGSCRTPIAGLAEIEGEALRFRGQILRPDGSESHAAERQGAASDALALAEEAARELKAHASPGFFAEA